MAITDFDKVDFVSTRNKNEVILTISDHLDWNDINYHLEILQRKLNSYISFIESGEVFKTYPDSKDKNIIIEVVNQHKMPEEGINFLRKVTTVLNSIKVELRQRVLIEPSEG